MPPLAARVRTRRSRLVSRDSRRLGTVVGVALAAGVLTIPPASAHGIGGEAADSGVFGFVSIGTEHMLVGWDHLAFVAGVMLVARSASTAAKLISLFVLGHSSTLILATELSWRVNAGLVDGVIAVSVAFVGVIGIFGRPRRLKLFAAAVLLFGLVHGLGLATRFQDLGIPPQGRLAKVIAFNIGIEIGQATVVFALYVVAMIISGSRWWRADVTKAATVLQLVSASFFILGAVSGAYLLTQTLAPADPVDRAQLAPGTTCSIGQRTQTLSSEAGDHPPAAFYEPGDETPLPDFGHSLGDGYVIVLYAPELDDDEVTDLRELVETAEPGRGPRRALRGPA